ncbi:MAG: DNA-binding protein, partial [Spirochaetales bacterium]|nr:DNA-binding protein [Spirochaetales bacterium]
IFTSVSGNRITENELNDFNAQYPSLEVRETDEFHDRFLILDRRQMYHIGASIKDAGKKAFEISNVRVR